MARFFALLLASSLVVAFPVHAAELEKNSVDIEKIAQSRGTQISRELQRASTGLPDWSGKYFKGDGTGENIDLWLAPRAGFFFEWNGCLGVYDRNYGSVKGTSGRLRLQCELPNNPGKGFEGTATDFVPLRWGERHYLVPMPEMVDFCNAVNAREEPRARSFGSFLLREGDWEKAVTEAPRLPAPFVRFLLAKPIVTQIVQVQAPRALSPQGKISKNWRTTRVSVPRGVADGLLPGMELHVIVPDVVASAKVVRAERHSAEADFVQYGGYLDERPKMGWKLSTRPTYR
jgi:hypothetical protein